METAQALSKLEPAIAALGTGRRLVALAGPPGAGKTTLARALVARLSGAQAGGPAVAMLQMDGFHLDNRVLDARALRARKGAPETFDTAGFAMAVHRLAGGAETVLPIFDRQHDLAIAGAQVIGPEVELVVIEGNYLLFDAPIWRDLAPFWALSVFLEAPMDVLRQRLIERWRAHGLAAQAARARAESNDLVNAARILAAKLPADITLS